MNGRSSVRNIASYQAFFVSSESSTFEKPGTGKQHSLLSGRRLPNSNVKPFRLRAPAYETRRDHGAELVAHAGRELVGDRRPRLVVDQEDLGVAA